MYIPLEDGEKIVLMVHKHWWFIVVRVIGLVMFLAAPVVLWRILVALGVVTVYSATMTGLVALAALWVLVGWVLFWQFWTLYYMDMWVVTNRRLIDIDYRGFFDRNIAMLRLEKVQDLTVNVRGVLGSLFNYGHIVVQTAGTEKEFVMDQISSPEALRDAIMQVVKTNH